MAAGEAQRVWLIEGHRAVWGRPVKKRNGSKDPPLQDLWLRIGAALERRAIIVGAAGVVAGGLLLGLLGFGAQRRFAGGVIRHLAREHDVAQAALHGIEFGSGDDIFLPCGQNAGNLFLRVFDAFGRRWMR